jgi:hypothetical protein
MLQAKTTAKDQSATSSQPGSASSPLAFATGRRSSGRRRNRNAQFRINPKLFPFLCGWAVE